MARVVLVDALGWQAGILNLGLAYLAGSLQVLGHEVFVVDLNNHPRPMDLAVRDIAAHQPALIGFSIKSATFANAVALHEALLPLCPDAAYLYGGPHATLAGAALLESIPPAYVFRGEAEHALAEFVTQWEQGSLDPGSIPGLVFRDETGRIQQVPAAYPTSLNDLPFPDFTGFDALQAFTIYPLLTSRGCPYHCTYCSVPAISGSRWRARSVESVLTELEHVVGQLGLTTAVIVDDNFTLEPNRAKAICQGIVERGIQIEWSCANGIRADRIWPDLADWMVKAGCREVAFGIESWDPEVLSRLSKGEDHQAIRRGIAIAQAAGLRTTGFFMIGLPGATYCTDLRTLAMALRLGLDNYYFGLTVPYPGTALWTWAQANARFLIPWQNTYHISEVFRDGGERVRMEPVFDTPEYPAELRRRMFQRVLETKAERSTRSLKRLQRSMRHPPEVPVVVIRSSARAHFLALARDLFPASRHLLLWKGPENALAALAPEVLQAYDTYQLPGEGNIQAEDLASIPWGALEGCLVLFDAPTGTLDRYQNVLALARALNPSRVAVLLGEEFRQVALSNQQAI